MLQSKVLLRASIPVIHLFHSAAVFGVSLHCSDQRLRLYLLPLFITFSALSFTTATNLWFFSSLVSLWSQAVSLYILHAVSLLHIEEWPAPRSVMPTSDKQNETAGQYWLNHFRATYRVWGNPQLLFHGKHRDVNVPPKTQPHTVFLLVHLIKLLIYYYLHCHLFPLVYAGTIIDIIPEDVSPVQQTLLRRLQDVTAREIVVRRHTAIYWIWENGVS